MANILLIAEPWLLHLLFTGAAAGLFLSRNELTAALRKAGGKACLVALLITLAGAALRFYAFPPRHMVLFGEYSHIAIAQSLAKTGGRLCETQQGSIAAPEVCAASPWSDGYHVMLAAAFRLAGEKPGTAHLLSRMLDTCAIPLAFLTAFGIWGSPLAGLLLMPA